MACKNPVVAFDISSNPELISNNETGCLIPFDDREAFADALEDLIKNREKRIIFGEAGLKIVETKFNFDKNVKEAVNFLEKGV
jgi:glycosyltransferase involved in cell wall biosynthesis